MEPERRCPRCGRKIPWGQTTCPFCPGHGGYLWSLRRDTFLAVVIVLLILLFVITGFTVRRYHRVERRLAENWYSQGEQALKAGHAAEALADFRNALAYSRDNPLYQLRLAQALVATGRLQEARIYLLSLRDREPGNGPVNLELARLAVRERAYPEALQYFHDAVYCEWEGDLVVQRRAVRLELVKFLLDSDQKAAARAELIAVAANLPPDAKLQVQVGALLMNAGGNDDALRLFRQALAEEPHSAPALAGAGECYFLNGQYARAEPYLSQALRQDPNLTQAAAMRDTVRAVLDMDPFIRWLGEQDRERRAHQDFDQALTRLEACAAQRGIDLQGKSGDPLQTLYAQTTALQPRMRRPTLSRDAELVSSTMDLVFEIEKAASQACGEPQGLDLALVLIAREQEGARP
ncbi:MAG: tetratricopeptide repeat protein [Terriglobia bacterium]|jgi:tetratricopeptide (TPR) repeat protein